MAVSGKQNTRAGIIDNLMEQINKTGFWGGLVATLGLGAIAFGAVLFLGGLLYAFDIFWLWLLGLLIVTIGILDIYLVAWYGKIKK